MCIPWQVDLEYGTCATHSEAMMLEKKIKSRGAARFLEDAWHRSNVNPISRGALRAKVVSSNLAAPTFLKQAIL